MRKLLQGITFRESRIKFMNEKITERDTDVVEKGKKS